ncbi:sensor histidine kinase [Actinoplanes sp. CA-252034]|uniref:sensor histidine kinase n=1 Tax=Actinoplanes sp. CA-252034 TaxID=3239906 RepID=UPI003D9A0289
MRDLIDALLGYARAGSAPVRALTVPLDAVVEEVLNDLDPQIVAAGARVRVAGPLPVVIGDPVLLRQLLQNLIGNAVKYRDPDRQARVEIVADGPAVRIVDHGLGIPPERREEGFGMFARVDGAVAAGHGIGLSSCLRIVERHGGTIAIEDTPGGGATVTVTLPGKESGPG